MRSPIVALLLALACCAALAQDAGTLRARMGAEDFRRAGLDRLSEQELEHLEHWLAAHPTAAPPPEAPSARAAARGPDAHRGREKVQSRIAGRFQGWHRGSVLTLENGQQWRVVDGSELIVPDALEQPAVTVRPGLLGSWNLRVEGYNTQARVEPAN